MKQLKSSPNNWIIAMTVPANASDIACALIKSPKATMHPRSCRVDASPLHVKLFKIPEI